MTSPFEITPTSPGSLAERLEFETLISDLSSRFISLRPEELEGEINNALRVVCDALGIDLALLWQWPLEGPAGITPTHIYSVLDVAPPAEPMQQADYPWTTQQVLAGRMFAISTLGDLPAEASVDRETCRRYGIKSALCLPLLLGGESPVGALGLNALRAERDWPDTLVQRLQLVANILTGALDRGRREQRLQDSERRLAAGSALAGLAFYEVNFVARAMIIGDRLHDLFGFPEDQNQGLRFMEFWADRLHPDDRTEVLALREQLHSGELDQFSIEYRLVDPDRGERWVQHIARVTSRDASGRTIKSYGALRDITEFKRAEEAMRDLSRRLIHAHEQERALLARELHDDVTRRLAVLAIDVGRAELVVRDTPQAEVMRSVRDGLIRISEDIHSLAYQLHPSVLDELGLVEALRADCDRRLRQGRLEVSLDLDPSCAIVCNDAALCLFRVAQEAMNNITRHSGRHNASVTLRQMDGGFLLAVRDDGIGFDPARPGKGRSLGLASMRERVQLVNGTLDIEAAPGCGTTIVAWVPVEGEVQ